MEDTLYFGDNLDILREYIPDESIDLIYLDPPFNSQANYNVLFQSPTEEAASAQAEAFRDMWTWTEEAEWAYGETMKLGGGVARIVDALRAALGTSDMMAYLVMMAVRLEQLHRVLKPTGSLYLHCDPTASHYLKMLLDGIFGPDRFLNEIIWRRTNARGTTGRWPRIHDVLLYYSKGPEFTFHSQKTKADKAKLPHTLITGPDGQKYQTYEMTGPGLTKTGQSGQPWRGFDPSIMGRHWGNTHATMDGWDAQGLIHWPQRNGFPRRRAAEPFDPDSRKVTVGDAWSDIDRLNQTAKERLGYPTQKPISLLNRIIEASSNDGDVVLDPFCGCGTTIEAAERAGRSWIGIDVAIHAIKVIEARMAERLDRTDLNIEGMPRDYASAVKLAEKDKYQFQWWANYLFDPHALREQKKGADSGIDGELFFPNGPGRPWGRMLTSVKGGMSVGPAMVRDFRGVLEREKAEIGLFICLNKPTKAMQVEAASAGIADTVHGDLPRLQIVAIEEFFQNKLPMLPPLEHLPSAAFASAKRRRPVKSKRPDPTQPEFQYTFTNEKASDSVVHFNPTMVDRSARKKAS